MAKDYDYGQLLDDFELGADVMPGESLTDYIERRRREFESKANGGSIGIEVLFGPKREDFNIGGSARPNDRVYDSRATAQDYAQALKNVSAGTTYQQQADAKRYARQEAANELRAARQGGDVALDNFLRSAGASDYRGIFSDSRPGTNRQGAFTGTYNVRKDQLLDRLMNQKLQATSYAPPSPPRDNLGLLMQDTIITDQMKSPAEMEAIRKKVLAAQKAQEQSYFLTDPVTGKKYSSQDEAIDDLGIVTYNQRFADGGRVGLFMGGDPLTGQALSIYESMNAYGFTDQQIADALQGQGLYTPSGSGTPETTAPNIINQQLQTGGDRDNNFGGQGIGSFGNLDPNTKQTMQVEVADGKGGVMIKEVDTYLDAGGMRKTLDNKNPVNAGLDIKTPGIAIFESLFGKKTDDKFLEEGKILGPFNNPNYKDLSFFGKIKADASRQKELKQLQKEFELQEQLKKQIAKEEADRAAQYGATNYGRGSDGQQSYDFGTGFGTSATTGGPVSNRTGRGRTDYSKGGLATMFTRRR